MGLHLVYIGAAAESAPAASLRALAGCGAAVVPTGTSDEVRALVEESCDAAPVTEAQAAEAAALCARAGAGEVTVAVTGEGGPALARALLAAASVAGVVVRTTPRRELFDDCLIGQELLSLRRITAVLRERCPWDRAQGAADIVSYTLEEAYELADAIAGGGLDEQHAELGDLLFQVCFLTRLLEEEGAGDLGSVGARIEAKLIRRHAHVFADAVAETPAEVRGQWERIKRDQEGREGVFHDVPQTFPAMLFARKVQQRAAAVGFDWDEVREAFLKIAEEQEELAQALAGDHDDVRLRHELGDLLFAVVNVARKAGVDPELALRGASRRFVTRVEKAIELAAVEGVDWTTLRLDEQDRYYRRAKSHEGAADAADHQEGTS